MKTIVIYHDNCPDGFCAAWLLRLVYPDAEFIPAAYGDTPPDVQGSDVIIADFSYPRETMESLFEKSNSLICFDHHQTAQAALKDLDYCYFDMNRCGAMMVLDYFKAEIREQAKHEGFELANIMQIVVYVQDRDLWLWKYGTSKQISAAIASYPFTFEAWDRFMSDVDRLYTEGVAVLRYQEKAIVAAVEAAEIQVIKGHTVLAVNNTVGSLISEIGQRLARGAPFGATYYIKDDRIHYSLRSHSDGVDVSEIAKAFGGGGHKHAAGFSVPLPEALEKTTI